MAWENYGWAWNVVGVQGSEYIVLLFLANEANSAGLTPMVKVAKITRRCNLSRRSVFEYLKRLEDKGFITRKRKWAKLPYDANAFQLDLKRYYPRGQFNNALELWSQILSLIPAREIEDDLPLLKHVSEVFLQKNAKVLHLVTTVEAYEDVVVRNLRSLKKAGKLVKPQIRRFEVFQKPFLK